MHLHGLPHKVRRFFHQHRLSRALRGGSRPDRFIEELEMRTLLSALPAPPTGLAVVLSNDDSNAKPVIDSVFQQELALISNPNISGIAFQIDWSDIEPVNPTDGGTPDWGRINQVFAAAKQADNKWVQLLIFPGFWSPQWVIDSVAHDTFKVEYGAQDDHEKLPLPLPLSTNTAYFNDWFAFMDLVGQQYGANPDFRVIAAAGPTSVSVEATEPANAKGELKEWKTDVYTQSLYISAWQEVFSRDQTDFPNQYISLSHGSGLPIPNAAAAGSGPQSNIQLILNEATTTLGAQFTYQSSALSGLSQHHNQALQSVISYNGGPYVTGFQMGTSAQNHPTAEGTPGDPPLGLGRAIDNGLQLNTNGQHADYVEIQGDDVAADDLQPVLSWAATLFPIESAENVIMTSTATIEIVRVPFRVNVTFSEPTKGFKAKNLVVTNGIISNFTGSGSSYSFTLTPTVVSPGVTSVDIPANTINGNTAAPQFRVVAVSPPSKIIPPGDKG